MNRRALALTGVFSVALLAAASPVTAHPLGNSTVNRAVAATIVPDEIRIAYIIDMAEIPAFAALLSMDADADGGQSVAEKADWAGARCAAVGQSLDVEIAGQHLEPQAGGRPALTFPPGVGGLETLRLECGFRVSLVATAEPQTLTVADTTHDGVIGWREVSITAGRGIVLEASDAPSVSPSSLLTAYPKDQLQSPLDVTSGEATFRSTSHPAAEAATSAATMRPPLATNEDPLAALVGGLNTPWGWLVALALAGGLGAAHALSPGHGKAIIAAYLVGARGTLRRATALGLTVAISHTLGVFILGAIVLSASEFLVPERVVAWLSVTSGVLVVLLGASVAGRALRGGRARTHAPEHGHHHPHGHDHAHGHDHGHVATHAHPPLREVVTLGLAGGMVPSASALIVLLVAVTTGKVLQGMVLIAAFGLGMALVLAGLAAATTLARNGLAAHPRLGTGWKIQRFGGVLPLATAAFIIVAGAAATLGALGNL